MVLKYYEKNFDIINCIIEKRDDMGKLEIEEKTMKIIAIEKRLESLSKVKIGKRLFIGFSLLLLFILIVGAGSIINVSLLSSEISILNEMMDTENSVAFARVEQVCFEVEGTQESADKTQEYIEEAKQAIKAIGN